MAIGETQTRLLLALGHPGRKTLSVTPREFPASLHVSVTSKQLRYRSAACGARSKPKDRIGRHTLLLCCFPMFASASQKVSQSPMTAVPMIVAAGTIEPGPKVDVPGAVIPRPVIPIAVSRVSVAIGGIPTVVVPVVSMVIDPPENQRRRDANANASPPPSPARFCTVCRTQHDRQLRHSRVGFALDFRG